MVEKIAATRNKRLQNLPSTVTTAAKGGTHKTLTVSLRASHSRNGHSDYWHRENITQETQNTSPSHFVHLTAVPTGHSDHENIQHKIHAPQAPPTSASPASTSNSLPKPCTNTASAALAPSAPPPLSSSGGRVKNGTCDRQHYAQKKQKGSD